jgi:ABC-type transporter Mla MlaB component
MTPKASVCTLGRVAAGHHVPLAVPIRSGEHACCRFDDARDRSRLTLAFVRARVRRGDKVIYFADGDGVEAFDLQGSPALVPARERGQLEIRPSQDVYLQDGRFEPERILAMLLRDHEQAAADGYRGLSVAGEVPPTICQSHGGDQLTSYEAQVASRCNEPSYALLCQYDHRKFHPDLVEEVVESHQVDAAPELAAIGRAGELAAVWDRRRSSLRLAGELDYSCAGVVSAVLDERFPDQRRLDLADLSYVDVAGMRALRGRAGQRLTIGPVSHAVRRLVPLLGWDTDPDIELMEAR